MSFSMAVSDEIEVKEMVENLVKPVPEEVLKLQETASNNVNAILNLDEDSTENFDQRKLIVKTIEEFGLQTMQSSSQKNSLLKVSVDKLSKSGDEGGTVAKGLSELQIQLKDLDPSIVDFAKTGFLGKFFNPLRAYFQKYEKADAVISDIVISLDKGKKTLQNDNTTLEFEQQGLRTLTKTLQKEIELGIMMDQLIEAGLEKIKLENNDPDKVKFIAEEVLFPLRQRVMDLQQMLVVNQQGIIAYEVVIRNNRELIRGVERAKTVTVSALKNAITVASALYNQKIVLKKIEALNQTTNSIIAGTSSMLKTQGAEIQKQAIESSISVDTLKQSFADVIEAMDSINEYKQAALPQMRSTIESFKELADVGEKQIQKFEKGNATQLI